MKLKLKICNYDGTKIDSVIINNETDAKTTFRRWKLKGLF
jgi:hypothetical protein